MSIDEIIEKFSVDRILGHPAVFDPEKLEWMNASYIRNLEDNILSKMIIKEVDRPKEKKEVLISEKVSIEDITDRISILTPLIRERLRNVSESSFLLEYFYDDLEIKKDTLLPKKVEPKSIIDGLSKSITLIDKEKKFEPETLEEKFRELAKKFWFKSRTIIFSYQNCAYR